MDALSAAAALITLAALFSWLNQKFIHQPRSIALLLFSLVLSVALVVLGKLGLDSWHLGKQAINSFRLDRVLLDSMPRSCSPARCTPTCAS
jgi:CPA1 family monovalent cation:H+ antiporter